MPGSYIPLKLSAYKNWMLNFSTLLSAAPATFGQTAGDAAAVANSYAIFAAAYSLSSSNATRTPVTVQDTQTARNNLSALVRSYVRLILANAGVLDSDKLALGLVIRDTHPTKIPAPGTAPVLALVGCTPGVITATFRDTGSSLKSRSKPAGVSSLELHAFFGTVAPGVPRRDPLLRGHHQVLRSRSPARPAPLAKRFGCTVAGRIPRGKPVRGVRCFRPLSSELHQARSCL